MTGLVPLASGHTARDVGVVSKNQEIVALFKPLGALLGRYHVDSGNPLHRSATSVVYFATDVLSDKVVVLKFMRDNRDLSRELSARLIDTEGDHIVRILACHIPSHSHLIDFEQSSESGFFLVVMEHAGESLNHTLSSQRVAGYDSKRATNIARSLARQLKGLHDKCVVHFDIKPRNILLRRETSSCKRVRSFSFLPSRGSDEHRIDDKDFLLLCDMDESEIYGNPRFRGEKLGSGAYCAPEVASFNAGLSAKLLAEFSIDVWSFGVVLYELTSGRHLFPQVSVKTFKGVSKYC